jgi:hypothetical protein
MQVQVQVQVQLRVCGQNWGMLGRLALARQGELLGLSRLRMKLKMTLEGLR